MTFVRERTDVKQAEIDASTVRLCESARRPSQFSQNIVVNSPARVLSRVARGGPERLQLLRIILIKIPWM